MEHYVGLDVSLKLTAICIVDRTAKIVREGVITTDPETIAAFIKSHAPHVARVGLEVGATSTWLWTELNKMWLPVICIDARHAKAVLKMQINKSDRNDAVGIARIMQCGWYKEVRVEDLDSHATKALLEGQGRRIVKKSILAAAMSAFVSTAQAQGYVLQPSQVPAYVTPGSNGTAVLQTPGRGPTYLIPRGDGSYVIPGQRPTYVTPRGNGTYAIQSPGRAPAYLTPTTPRPCFAPGRC